MQKTLRAVTKVKKKPTPIAVPKNLHYKNDKSENNEFYFYLGKSCDCIRKINPLPMIRAVRTLGLNELVSRTSEDIVSLVKEGCYGFQ